MNQVKIIILLVLISTIQIVAQNHKTLGVKTNKSIAIFSDEVGLSYGLGLIDGVYGLGVDYQTRVNNKSYLNISFGYSSYTTNNSLEFENNKKLEAHSFDLIVNGIFYFSEPNQITPYMGIGIGMLFGISNKDEISIKIHEDAFFEFSNELFYDYSLLLNPKIGILLPLNTNLFGYADVDVFTIITGNKSVIPKLNLGISYWID